MPNGFLDVSDRVILYYPFISVEFICPAGFTKYKYDQESLHLDSINVSGSTENVTKALLKPSKGRIDSETTVTVRLKMTPFARQSNIKIHLEAINAQNVTITSEGIVNTTTTSIGMMYSAVIGGFDQNEHIDTITIEVVPKEGETVIVQDLLVLECAHEYGKRFASLFADNFRICKYPDSIHLFIGENKHSLYFGRLALVPATKVLYRQRDCVPIHYKHIVLSRMAVRSFTAVSLSLATSTLLRTFSGACHFCHISCACD